MTNEIKTEPYNEAALNRLQKMFDVGAEGDSPRFYEVAVDGVKVISRTNNPSEFQQYKRHLDRDAKNLKVTVYHDNSFEGCDEYNYALKEEKQSSSLNGPFDLDSRISEKINAAKKEWDYDQMVKEKAQLETDLKDANEYIETLEKGIEDFKSKKFQLGDVNLGELASVVFEGILRRNADKIAKIPGAEALAGIFKENPNQISEPAQEKEPEVKIEKEAEMSEEDKIFLAVAHWLKANFSNEEIAQVNIILKTFAQDKKLIATVQDLLTQNQKKQ